MLQEGFQIQAAGSARTLSTLMESERGSSFLFEHDLFRKPVSTFRDHALIDGLGFALRLFKQFEVALDVGTSRVLALCREQRRAGATIITAQHE